LAGLGVSCVCPPAWDLRIGLDVDAVAFVTGFEPNREGDARDLLDLREFEVGGAANTSGSLNFSFQAFVNALLDLVDLFGTLDACAGRGGRLGADSVR
jgi:hypothetical protein